MGSMKTIAIIGGGAAGLAAAVAAGEAARAQGIRACVRVFEASDRVGRPILATGNGRCNFSNAHIDPAVYRNGDFVEEALAQFEREMAGGVAGRGGGGGGVRADGSACGSSDSVRTGSSDGVRDGARAAGLARIAAPNGVVRFFEQHGLAWREEGEGRLYPQANKASVVLDVLRSCAQATGAVEERCCASIAAVEPPRSAGRPFTLRTAEGVFERADAVIVACGGRVARDLLPGSFAYAEPRPLLCPLAVSPADARVVRELNNIRAKGALTLRRGGEVLAVEVGEVMFRKFGVSGIAAFNLSRLAAPGDELLVDLLPHLAAGEVPGLLRERQTTLAELYGAELTWGSLMRGMLLPQVSDVLLGLAGLEPDGVVRVGEDAAVARLASLLKAWPLGVAGPAEPEHAQVHRGGYDPWAFSPVTFEALAVPELHVVGEALDIDAPCGGYNLHWAWASGIMAGRHAAVG